MLHEHSAVLNNGVNSATSNSAKSDRTTLISVTYKIIPLNSATSNSSLSK